MTLAAACHRCVLCVQKAVHLPYGHAELHHSMADRVAWQQEVVEAHADVTGV